MKTNADNQLITSIVRTANEIAKKRKEEANYSQIPDVNIKRMAALYGISNEKVCEILREYFKEHNMKTLKEEYIDYLKRFSESINDETLKSVGIKSVAVMQEVLIEDPMPPRLLVKRLDGNQYTVDGMEEIQKHLNHLFRDI